VSLLISHPQADVSSDLAVVGSFHQVGLQSNPANLSVEHCIKTEVPEQIGTVLYCHNTNLTYGRDDEELMPNRKRSRGLESMILDDASLVLSSSPKKPKSTTFARKEVLMSELLQHWKQFELKETLKVSKLDIDNGGSLVECPSSSFEQLLNSQGGTDGASQEAGRVSIDDAHAIVSFVTAVASPEALVQFKQALIGWRTQGLLTELMKTSGISSVLKALDHLEAQNRGLSHS
jgi:hypothetical protein